MCLNSIPLLLPGASSSVKNRLLRWFERNDIQPNIVAEFDDSALMKAFGKKGAGVFVAPSVTATEVMDMYDVEVLGETDEVVESFYAISIERKIKHTGVIAILNAAREHLFMNKILHKEDG